MGWKKKGNDVLLFCDGCKVAFDYPGPRVLVVEAARAHGWHIYRGPSLTNKELDSYLCDECVGTPRTKLPKVEHFQEEIPLWTEGEL